MLDIASFGNGLVGPGREVNGPRGGRLETNSSPRTQETYQDRPGGHPTRSVDRVEVSEHADLMARLEQVPDVRWDRIESVRAAIGEADYINQHLDKAIDQLLSDI
ncbi:MAG: flagellar biosynthesis anti-sigma factor FlgM [Phycisphaerales bacterium]|nr:flagellar biosynthesis anti-sigma factor FlgM [Phycisphaerales bacterium]